jgi:hypothetical protein
VGKEFCSSACFKKKTKDGVKGTNNGRGKERRREERKGDKGKRGNKERRDKEGVENENISKIYVVYQHDIWWCIPPNLHGLFHKICVVYSTEFKRIVRGFIPR